MPSIYLDQNALINSGLRARSNPAFKAKFAGAIATERFTPTVSAWHWVEASRTRNIASAGQLADFIDSLNPGWLRERRDLEKTEVQEAFFRFCGVPFEPIPAIVRRVDLIAALNRRPADPTVDRTSRQFVEGWINQPESMQPLIQSYQANADALRNLRKAVCEGRVTNAIKLEGDRQLIESFLPDRTPAGILVSREVRNNFLTSARIEQFPSLSVEAAIAEHSWRTTEEPDWNSMVDKFHLISALPYVDIIVSDDDYFHAILPVVTPTGFVRATVIRFAEFCAEFVEK